MFVYFHRNQKTFDIFYVGVGTRISRAYELTQGRNPYYKNYLIKHGKPIVQIVHKDLTKENAHYWEKFYIGLLGRKIDDGPLVNITEGGDATPILPAESRKRSTDALMKWVRDNPDKNSMKRPEVRAKLSGDNNSSKRTEVREKLRQANLGKKASEETKKKMSIKKIGKRSPWLIGYKHSPETINKIAVKSRIAGNTESFRIKQRLDKLGKRKECNHIPVQMINANTNEIIKTFQCIIDALTFLYKPIKSGNISGVCKGHRRIAYGYKWQYAIRPI